jgi:hypothetical protein
MTHTFAANLLFGNLHAASVTNDAAIADSLIFSAIALIILCGTEYLLAEETIPLGLIGAVVYRLRLEYFTTTPLYNVLRRGKRDADGFEIALNFIVFIVESGHFLLYLFLIIPE